MTSEPLTVDELAGITIDPMVMSGQPVIKGTRIPASTVAARFFGGKSVVYLAKDHNLRFDQVEAAIRWHLESHSRQLWLEAFNKLIGLREELEPYGFVPDPHSPMMIFQEWLCTKVDPS